MSIRAGSYRSYFANWAKVELNNNKMQIFLTYFSINRPIDSFRFALFVDRNRAQQNKAR